MAFVSEKPLPPDVANRTAAANVGPGQYDVDSTAHKELMAAIYPKKVAPFNSTEKRAKERKQKDNSPGKPARPACFYLTLTPLILFRTWRLRSASKPVI